MRSKYHGRMRMVLILVAGALLLLESGSMARPARGTYAAAPVNVSTSPAAPKAHVDFDTQLKPIFKSKCMPCHFNGGQMYERLPFDKPETIRKLSARLFTRIDNADDKRLIEDFLKQQSPK